MTRKTYDPTKIKLTFAGQEVKPVREFRIVFKRGQPFNLDRLARWTVNVNPWLWWGVTVLVSVGAGLLSVLVRG